MKQLVLPIKDTNVLHEVEDTLLHNLILLKMLLSQTRGDAPVQVISIGAV